MSRLAAVRPIRVRQHLPVVIADNEARPVIFETPNAGGGERASSSKTRVRLYRAKAQFAPIFFCFGLLEGGWLFHAHLYQACA